MTDAEQLLWKYLRRRQVCGHRFYRQKIIENYIVDFYCSSASLVIELDGGQHTEQVNMLKDEQRDAFLSELGMTVFRFNNNDVMSNVEGVLAVIYEFLKDK